MERHLIADFRKCKYSDVKYGREPVIAMMPDKTLICIMVTGGPTEPHNKNVVVVTRSEDNGKTWGELELLFHHECRGVWGTEIYTGFSKPMMVVYTYNGDCPYKELQTFVSYTEDCGKTWSEPISIAPFANGMCLRKGIKLSNKETLFPVYYTDLFGKFNNFLPVGDPLFWRGTRHSCGVVITSDEGKSYQPFGTIQLDPVDVFMNDTSTGKYAFSPHLWEPNCVETEPGHLIMYMRDSHFPYVYKAESFDYGRTWPNQGSTSIANADSKLVLEKINNSIILVSNNTASFEFANRTHLLIQSSKDGCKNWTPLFYVSEKDDCLFYPHIATDQENEKVFLAYEDGIRHYVNIYSFKELGLL